MIRHDQGVVRLQPDVQAITLFDLRQRAALVVEQIDGNGGRYAHGKLARPLQDAFLLNLAQNREGGRLGRPPHADATAGRTDLEARLKHARPQTLARELQQAEGADAAELNAGLIVLHRFLQAPLDLRLVARDLHVDEINDDQAGEVTQTQVAGDLLRGFEVGAQRRLLDVPLARCPAGVDIDRDQRLGRIDYDVTAGLQMHRHLVHRFELPLDTILVQQGHHRVVVELHLLGVARREQLHEFLGDAVLRLALDDDFLDIPAVKVADRALDQAAFLVDEGRRHRAQRRFADVGPQPQQILVVTANLGLAAAGAGGAHDHRHPLRNLELGDDLFQAPPVNDIGDLARDAATAGGVGHQHAATAGERQIGRECRALVAALFLDDLHQHDLAPLDDFLDLVVAGRQARPLPLDVLVLIHAGEIGGGFALLAFGLLGCGLSRLGRLGRSKISGPLRSLVLRKQGFPVGDRDLVVVRMDFVEGEKAVPITAVIDESGLQRRLDARHLGEIDIPFQLATR